MKNIQILTSLIFLVSLYQCQQKKIDVRENMKKYSQEGKTSSNSIFINIGKEISIIDTDYMKLYKYDETNECEQSKAVSVIYDNRISVCFDYVRRIEGEKVKDFINLVRNPKTYGAEDVACFDTDYSLILYNSKDEITGYINISNSCNKLISNPKIKEMEFYSRDGLRKVGFSKGIKEKIQQILGI
ncbi:hypothetical protein [Chryseobacterium indologenes]|uniref:hypothetical protein n=1 Tax=Chryseobacterium indologenes TaxID=253 RepID=UPI00405A3BBC